MSLINGKSIFILVRNEEGAYYPIACDSSCTISINRDIIPVTGPGDGLWRRVIPGGRITASVNGNGLINFQKHMSLFTMQKMLVEGTPILMMCEIPDNAGGSAVYEATGYITSMEFTGAYRAAGSFVYSIEIDGAVSMENTIPLDPAEIGIENLLLIDAESGEFLSTGDSSSLII